MRSDNASGPVNLVLAGILLMLVGNLMFTLNDAMGKWLVASFSVGQVLLIRSIGAFAVLGPMVANTGPGAMLRVERPDLQLFRVALATADTGLFYAAVIYLPLADVMTFYMAGPIFMAVFSHLLLGEAVGWRRWTAIAVGFVGVVVALRPSSASLSLPSLLALFGSLSFSLSLVLSRRLRGTPDTVLVTWQTLAALLVGGVLSLFSWTAPSFLQLLSMLLLGIVSASAHLMITRALKLAPASTLAPLHYTLLPWAILFGYLFFGDLPDRLMLAGSAIIVLSGLFIFHRQKLRGTLPPEAVPREIP